MGPRDGVGGKNCAGAMLGCNIRITVCPALGISLVPPNGVGYGPWEVTGYRIYVGADKNNPEGRKKGGGAVQHGDLAST